MLDVTLFLCNTLDRSFLNNDFVGAEVVNRFGEVIFAALHGHAVDLNV